MILDGGGRPLRAGVRVRIGSARRLPPWGRVLAVDERGGAVEVDGAHGARSYRGGDLFRDDVDPAVTAAHVALAAAGRLAPALSAALGMGALPDECDGRLVAYRRNPGLGGSSLGLAARSGRALTLLLLAADGPGEARLALARLTAACDLHGATLVVPPPMAFLLGRARDAGYDAIADALLAAAGFGDGFDPLAARPPRVRFPRRADG